METKLSKAQRHLLNAVRGTRDGVMQVDTGPRLTWKPVTVRALESKGLLRVLSERRSGHNWSVRTFSLKAL